MFKRYWDRLSKLKKVVILLFLLPAIALAATVSHQQIVNAIKNSPNANAWLKQNAESVANLALKVESGGRLDVYNGSCCFGVLQMNRTNIRVYAKMTPAQFQKADLQTQVNAWSKLTSQMMNTGPVRRLIAMGTFDGRPVTGELVMACIQLGVGNCQKMINSGSCNGFKDSNGTSICAMADKMAGRGTAVTTNGDEPPPDPPTVFPADILDKILTQFENAASQWGKPIIEAATYLFWVLATISLVWTGISLVLRKGDISDFFQDFVGFILFIGFFYWLLVAGIPMAKDVVESFIQLGMKSSSDGTLITVSFMEAIFNMWARAYQGASQLGPAELTGAVIIMAVTFIALALIAVNFVLLNIAAWVYLYAGIFTLGFGGSRWTSEVAITYYKQLLNLSLQLMTMILLMSIGESIIGNMVNDSQQLIMADYVVFLTVGITLAILCNKVPPMVGSTVGGIGSQGVGFTASGVASTMLTAVLMIFAGAGFAKIAAERVAAAAAKGMASKATSGAKDNT